MHNAQCIPPNQRSIKWIYLIDFSFVLSSFDRIEFDSLWNVLHTTRAAQTEKSVFGAWPKETHTNSLFLFFFFFKLRRNFLFRKEMMAWWQFEISAITAPFICPILDTLDRDSNFVFFFIGNFTNAERQREGGRERGGQRHRGHALSHIYNNFISWRCHSSYIFCYHLCDWVCPLWSVTIAFVMPN